MLADDMDENRPETRIGERSSDDLIKILLATDCHIGVHERDPIRGQDSINTFREVLQHAVKHDVDMVLLAGDLFHENRPSRESLYQTISLLREYTLGDKPISIELLSSPDDGKASGYEFPAINYEDPNYNVAIPVFSIHGNHDDPQGAGGHEGALCALDLLSVTGLVNYIGKIDLPHERENEDGTGIIVRPVLLKKGNTKLAMYGIGNVKDQRMHHQLRSNRIKMFTPRDKDDWFNIMLLHQNRVKRGPIDCVPEGMFDDSIDLIVWGHEHDCRIEPEPVAGKRYYITQPGSTVATSLADGESITKNCALLEIQGKSFEITPIVLRTVRPFQFDTIQLAEVAEEEEININDKMAINTYLKRRVNELILAAKREFEERNADAEEAVQPMLPLIRLRVDTTGVPEMSNPQRFGLEFVQKIANPRDVLHFIRSKTRNTKNIINEPELEIDQLDLPYKQKVDKVRVDKLVHEYLGVQELQILGTEGMSDAIETYVTKEDNHAISSFVKTSERSVRKNLAVDEQFDENDLEDNLASAKETRDQEYRRQKEQEAEKEKNDPKGKGKGKGKDDDAASVDSMLQEEDSMDIAESRPAPRARAGAATAKAKAPAKPKAKAAPARGKGKKAASPDSEPEDFDDIIMDVDEPEDDMPPPPKPTRGKAPSAPAKSAPPKKAPARGKKATPATTSAIPSRSRAGGTQKTIVLSSDSE